MIDDKWVCHDAEPVERFSTAHPTGLCKTCGLVYDEDLYAAYLRRRVKSFTNVQEFLENIGE